jgi:hypothetical protein
MAVNRSSQIVTTQHHGLLRLATLTDQIDSPEEGEQ